MKRRLFMPYGLPGDIPKDVRTAIQSDIRRQLYPRPCFWIVQVALFLLNVAGGLAFLLETQGFVSNLGQPLGDLIQNVALLGGFVVMFLVWNFIHHRLYDDVRRAAWLAHGVCPDCGYNLTGNTSRICPECGANIPSSPSLDASPDQKDLNRG